MLKIQHLNKAPIAEAIIDFRVVLPENIGEAELVAIAGKVDGYPIVEKRKRASGALQFSDEKEPSLEVSSPEFHGCWCKTEDGRNIAQIRRDGFTFSELAPYSDWDSFSQKALKWWRVYKEALKPEIISRAAVRYVNQIEIEWHEGFDLDTYLTSGPKVPDGLPQEVAGFLSRISILGRKPGIRAHIVQSISSGDAASKTVVLLLDIDAFYMLADDAPIDGEENILSLLHDFKNEIFFSYVTEPTLELLK